VINGAAGAGSTIFLSHISHSRQTHPDAARIFGMRIRLYAVAVSTKNHSTRPRPRCRVLRKPPTVFIHPKGSSMRLRLIVLMR
jgi:hypothetical protein